MGFYYFNISGIHDIGLPIYMRNVFAMSMLRMNYSLESAPSLYKDYGVKCHAIRRYHGILPECSVHYLYLEY